MSYAILELQSLFSALSQQCQAVSVCIVGGRLALPITDSHEVSMPATSRKQQRTPAPLLDFSVTLDETLPLVRRARYRTAVRRGRTLYVWGQLVELKRG